MHEKFCYFISKLSSIPFTLHNLFVTQALSVTFVKGGTALNVIPSYVKFGGTLRSQTTEGMYHFRQRLKEV